MRPWFEADHTSIDRPPPPLRMEPKSIELSVAIGILIFQNAVKKKPPPYKLASMFKTNMQCLTYCTSITYEMLLHNAVLQILYRCSNVLSDDISKVMDVAVDFLLQLTEGLLASMPHISNHGLSIHGSLLLCIDPTNLAIFISRQKEYLKHARLLLSCITNKIIGLSLNAQKRIRDVLSAYTNSDQLESFIKYWQETMNTIVILCMDSVVGESLPPTHRDIFSLFEAKGKEYSSKTTMNRPFPLHWKQKDVSRFKKKCTMSRAARLRILRSDSSYL